MAAGPAPAAFFPPPLLTVCPHPRVLCRSIVLRTVCVTNVHPAATGARLGPRPAPGSSPLPAARSAPGERPSPPAHLAWPCAYPAERVLIAHFGRCGYITRIGWLRAPHTGRRTGVVQLEFAAAADAQRALALSGSALLQRTVAVVPSDSPAAKAAASKAMRAAAAAAQAAAVAMPLMPLPPLPPPLLVARGRGRGRGGRRVFVRGVESGGRGRQRFIWKRPADEGGQAEQLQSDVGQAMDAA